MPHAVDGPDSLCFIVILFRNSYGNANVNGNGNVKWRQMAIAIEIGIEIEIEIEIEMEYCNENAKNYVYGQVLTTLSLAGSV